MASTTTGAAIGTAAATAAVTFGISAGVAGITYLITKWRRTGKQKIAATRIVDQAESYMIRNLDTYLSSPRTLADQQAAIGNFYVLWEQITDSVEGCGNQQLGDAGRRCISERQRGGVYDYFARYLDPIEQDTDVIHAGSVEAYVDPVTGQTTYANTPAEDTGGGQGPGTTAIAGLPVVPLVIAGGLLYLLLGGGD